MVFVCYKCRFLFEICLRLFMNNFEKEKFLTHERKLFCLEEGLMKNTLVGYLVFYKKLLDRNKFYAK